MKNVRFSIGYWASWMWRAIQLAALADGCTSPNPLVGAIVLDAKGKLVGEGFHARAGMSHAEVLALAQAGNKAKYGTLLVTLEPCCHTGRTPPCTETILKSGVSRVVIALEDPDPRVSGGGIAFLRNAGLEVITGVLHREAAYQNRAFLFRVKNGRPWGILKWAMSLDGKTGLPNGASKWITEKKARNWVHTLRAKCDAVIVGSGTLRNDDPLLTSRGQSEPEPLRVVLTDSLDLPSNAQLWDTTKAKTVIAYGPNALEDRLDELPVGPEALRLNSTEPIDLLNALAAKNCNSVLWEGGASLAAAAIKQRCVQEIAIVIAPKLLGGSASMTPLSELGFQSMNEVILASNCYMQHLGEDWLFRVLVSS